MTGAPGGCRSHPLAATVAAGKRPWLVAVAVAASAAQLQLDAAQLRAAGSQSCSRRQREMYDARTHAYRSPSPREGTYPAADMAERGLDAIPAGKFPYRDDSAVLYAALERYAAAIVAAHYKDGAAVAGDEQAQAFLADLAEGGAGEIPGFPSPAEVKNPEQLAKVVAKMMWFAGVQHHSVNSNKVGWPGLSCHACSAGASPPARHQRRPNPRRRPLPCQQPGRWAADACCACCRALPPRGRWSTMTSPTPSPRARSSR